jgi:hypothetical protein
MMNRFRGLLNKMRHKDQKTRSIWDTLYDLYCHMEEGAISGINVFKDEEDTLIIFGDAKNVPAKLKELKAVLGPKCEDYFRFLEFYNGITLGHWNIHPDKIPNLVIADANNTTDGNRINKLPIATYYADVFDMSGVIATRGKEISFDSLTPYYLSATGEVLVYCEGDPVLISHSFEEFMGECVLGPRYLEFGEEDATYRFLQQFEKSHAQSETEYLKKYGRRSDEDRNPTRDPRIITGYREVGLDMARQTYEQTKGLPAGTVVNFS